MGDLRMHTALRFRYPTTGKLHPWQLPGIEGDAGARLPTAMTCNNMEAVLAAAIGCMGLAWMPDFLAADALADGRLQQVRPHCPRTRGSSRCWARWAPSQCTPAGVHRLRRCAPFPQHRKGTEGIKS